MWVFREWEDMFQVGYYTPDGYFRTQYESAERVDAAQKVHFLNGGN